MPKVNREKYEKGGLPALKPEQIGNSTHAVLEVLETEEVNIPGVENNGLGRDVLVIRFKEFPDNNYYANRSSMKVIFDKLGDDTDEWIGALIPLHRVTAPNPRVRGTTVENLWVVPMEEWDAQVDEYIKEQEAEKAKASRRAQPTPTNARRAR